MLPPQFLIRQRKENFQHFPSKCWQSVRRLEKLYYNQFDDFPQRVGVTAVRLVLSERTPERRYEIVYQIQILSCSVNQCCVN